MWTVAAILALAAFSSTSEVQGHGMFEVPKARQSCSNAAHERGDYTLTAGWGDPYIGRGGVPGVCGDSFKTSGANTASDYASVKCPEDEWTTYEEGQVITIIIDEPADHGGFSMFNLATEYGPKPDQSAFEEYPLYIVNDIPGGPYLRHWHLDPQDTEFVEVQVQLPPGVSCPEGCMLQWTWWTAHLCGYGDDGTGQGKFGFCNSEEECGFYFLNENHPAWCEKRGCDHKVGLCNSLTPAVGERPQIFRNCADIRIMPSGNGGSNLTPSGGSNPTPSGGSNPTPSGGSNPTLSMDDEVGLDSRVSEGSSTQTNPAPTNPPPVTTFMLELAVVDLSLDTVVPISGPIVRDDYEEGFTIRAVVPEEEVNRIETVTFSTDDGYIWTEHVWTYDMFARGGAWSDPPSGNVSITVFVAFNDGSDPVEMKWGVEFI